MVANGRIEVGVPMLFIAFFFDLFDGLVARVFGWTSKIGVELDSLADAVSFVIAPAFIIYWHFFDKSNLGILVALAVSCFGVYRLANFNLAKEMGYFKGMSVPYFTTIIIGLYYIGLGSDFTVRPFFMAIILIFLGWLMISPVRFPNFKGKEYVIMKSVGITVLFVLAIFMIIGWNGPLIGILSQITLIILVLSIYPLAKQKFPYILYILILLTVSLIIDTFLPYPKYMFGIPLLLSAIMTPLLQSATR
jgi:CDP-diacylglycerol--serine O-phosphatidyltransferase